MSKFYITAVIAFAALTALYVYATVRAYQTETHQIAQP